MKYLPDTNIFIHALNFREPEVSFLHKQFAKGDILLSVVVIAEIYAKLKTLEVNFFDKLMGELNIINIDAEIAKQAGEYRSQMVKRSSRGYLQDCFLAAQAKVHHLTLVTNNKADFPIDDIKVITP